MNTAALPNHSGTSRPLKKPFWLLTASALALGLVAQASWSRPWNPSDAAADGRLVHVQVRVSGRLAPLFNAPGRYDRSYFQAFRGQNYSLLLHNNTDRRVGVLIA